MSRTKSSTPRRQPRVQSRVRQSRVRRGRIHRLHGSFLELLGFLALMASIACLINPGIVNHVLGDGPDPRTDGEINLLPVDPNVTPHRSQNESLQPQFLKRRATESLDAPSEGTSSEPPSASDSNATGREAGKFGHHPLPPLNQFQQSASWTPNTTSLAPRRTSRMWPIR